MKPSLTYAGRLERLFANLIDTTLLMIPAFFVVGLMSHTGAGATLAADPACLPVIFLCNTAYYTAFTSSKWQATPGKRLLNIHVIRTDGRRLTQRDALERFLAFILPSLPIYTSFIPEDAAQILVVWLSIFWFSPILTTPQRTGIHDRICQTRVVTGRVS